MWQRLLQMLGNQPAFIERLSETKIMKRAAQITVASYQSLRQEAKSISAVSENILKDSNSKQIPKNSNSKPNTQFFENFKKEMSKEYDKAKKDGLL